MRILLIDDDADDRALAAREVRREWPDADLVEVETPDELERAIAHDAIDLAVLDHSVGWSDGYAIFKRLRAADPDMPAIMFTGTLGEDKAVDAMKAGFDDYIIKDVARLPRLRASIRALLAQRQEREARRRAEARYRDLFERVTVGVFSAAPDGTFKDGNPALLKILGLASVDELRRHNLLRQICSRHHGSWWPPQPARSVAGLEICLERPDGGHRWVLIDAHRGANGATPVEGVLTDVTAQRSALERGRMLMREVHHRVHNNLQLVIALLSAQARRFDEPRVRRAFKDVSERIRSLALVQQKLYRGEDLDQVEFDAYLRDLTTAILRMNKRGNIAVDLQLAATRLQVDKAVPLGLIANELLTNTVKHAFPEGGGGRITVRLAREDDGLVLAISDDGVGLPDSPFPTGGGLGSQLVPLLATQLGARMEVVKDRGFTTTIRFRP